MQIAKTGGHNRQQGPKSEITVPHLYFSTLTTAEQ